MNKTLSEVWGQVEKMLGDGLSIIPVRDKQEGDKPPKTAYYKWKEYQSRHYAKDELWKDMERLNTLAVSIVCGKISGNLEVIDVDVKFKEDAGIALFAIIQDFDPVLFSSLRIHRTPSGGYHILYRVSDPPEVMPGNLKLAGRQATAAELIDKPKNKIYNFLETRGEGGYILAPPSMDYSVHRDLPIPLITWQQRTDLINLCRTMDEEIHYAPSYKATEKTNNYYEECPWDDYNKRADPIDIMLRNGWLNESTRNANNIYFTRPGKTVGISMSFREDIRKFYCFTSSTEFDVGKAYSPVDIILILEHNADKKSCYAYLVQNGYGSVRAKVEQSIAISLARKGKHVPQNFSPEAVQLNTQTIAQLKEDHPFGIFLKYDEDEDKLQVSREALVYVANNLGFRYHDEECVRVVGNFIYDITVRQFQDECKAYIKEEDADEYEKMCNVFEAFIQKNGVFTMSRLQQLDTSLILHDTKDTCYKCYQNGFLTITSDQIEFDEYSDFDLLIWDKIIQKRSYFPETGGLYTDFISKAVVNQEQIKRVLGYLSHEYKDETTGYIIVLVEACIDPKNGGGSGKNVLCNLLRLTTSYTSKPGAQTKFDEKFFQSWNRQRIFGISDVDKNFNFMFLKEPSTGSFIWKKLFKDEVEIPVEDAPKFIVQTNYSYEVSDGGLRRRIIPIEFTDFFTKCGGLDVFYKKHFPNEWSSQDYAGFDNYIAVAIQEWLKCGRKLTANALSDTGTTKQWEQTSGHIAADFIMQHIDIWIPRSSTAQTDVPNHVFKQQLATYYEENSVNKLYQPSLMKINIAIESYCYNNGILFKKDVVIYDSFGNGFKSRVFENTAEREPF
jgi:hypothetical protein